MHRILAPPARRTPTWSAPSSATTVNDFVNDEPVTRTALSADVYASSPAGVGTTATVTAICAPAALTTP